MSEREALAWLFLWLCFNGGSVQEISAAGRLFMGSQADAAFADALMRAKESGAEPSVEVGTVVDTTPLLHRARFTPEPLRSGAGSAAGTMADEGPEEHKWRGWTL